MRTRRLVSLCLALALAIPACGKREPEPPETETVEKEPMITLPVVESMTYLGLEEGVAVTLDHGRWVSDTAVPGSAARAVVALVRNFILIGDVDGDSHEDGLVFLEGHSGRNTTNVYWALVQHRDDEIQNTAIRRIGDRVQIRDARFEHDRILLDVVEAGPDDELDFPGQLQTRIWEWNSGTWQERGNPNPPERLSLDTIEGTRWRLRALNDSTPAPETPEVTLSYSNGRFSGRGACNTYSAAVHQKKNPGEIGVSLPVATRMACADSVMRLESRFLSLLPKADRFGFAATDLLLEYPSGDSRERLYFERIPSEGGDGQLSP
ncbi:MAG TPA: META domain-containing protein [Candidatus Eisenbacteria bacterium]|nr:META domain-containing protein [Candidatus Eisenbacteria bacterium]